MGMRWFIGMVGVGIGLLVAMPSVFAADGTTAEAAQIGITDTTREQILQTIEATRQTDPELAAEMESQLRLLDSGELTVHDVGPEHGLPNDALTAGSAPGGVPGGSGFTISPPVDGDLNQPGAALPPEVRAQLEQLFDQHGTGDPSQDAAIRAEAERILLEHGIDPHDMGAVHEGGWTDVNGDNLDDETGSVLDGIGRGDGFRNEWDNDSLFRGPEEGMEHSWEQMSPEAQEQMERFFQEHEGEQPTFDRESFEREFGTYEHEGEVAIREFEAPTMEYEAPTHEYEAPMHEYEAPVHEYEQPEYEAPQPPEYQPPQP